MSADLKDLELGLYIFLLAGFLGYHLITRVPPLLHTPLMSATNAISGISLIGSLVVAGGGYSPESAGASVLPPAPRPRRGVEPPRSRSELLAYPTFSEMIDEGRRLGIVSEFQEIRRDTLDLELREGRDSSPRTSYYLNQLFAAYKATTDWSRRSCIELWWDGKPVGLYNSAGLTWE